MYVYQLYFIRKCFCEFSVSIVFTSAKEKLNTVSVKFWAYFSIAHYFNWELNYRIFPLEYVFKLNKHQLHLNTTATIAVTTSKF